MRNRSYFSRRPWRSVGVVAATVGLSVGLAVGVLISQRTNDSHNFWPNIPVHASATDAQANYALATGQLDDDVEGLFFLDALTGDLKAAVLNNRSQRFQAFFERNILKDFGKTPLKNPRFLMVTGQVRFLRQANGPRFGNSAIYVMEVNSGKCVAYGIPSPVNRVAITGNVFKGKIYRLDVVPFRNVQVRDNDD